VCRILKQFGLKKVCAKLGSEDADRCQQRNSLMPYSPDVAPSDYHLFHKLKESLRGTRFEDDDVIITVAKWFRRAGPEFNHAGIPALVPRWRKAIERDGGYVEKLHFVPKGCINIVYK
jgi:hypothetical protein